MHNITGSRNPTLAMANWRERRWSTLQLTVSSARQSVLVTGASGFIGRRLVRRLIELDRQVFCLVRPGSRVDELPTGDITRVSGDVTDRATVDRALAESRPHTVFHLAGLVRAGHHCDFMVVNAGGVEHVAGACADHDDPPVLVLVSSLAAAGPVDADQTRTERDTATPVSNYGRSKLAGERAAARYAHTVPITIVRPPIVFGPGDHGVLQMFRSISHWGIHVVPRRGDQRLSLIHVDDLVEGLLLAAEKGERVQENGPPGQGVYFFAGAETPTLTQLGRDIASALGRKPPTVIRVPGSALTVIGMGADLLARARRRASPATWINSDKITEALSGSWTCSASKARAHLGWPPIVPDSARTLADRLHETAQWYREAGWL